MITPRKSWKNPQNIVELIANEPMGGARIVRDDGQETNTLLIHPVRLHVQGVLVEMHSSMLTRAAQKTFRCLINLRHAHTKGTLDQ